MLLIIILLCWWRSPASTGPTNATGTPIIKNLLIKDVVLTEVTGPGVVFTLAEAPIQNFTMVSVNPNSVDGLTCVLPTPPAANTACCN